MVRRIYKRRADSRVSTTDPDASPMYQKKKSASRLRYLTRVPRALRGRGGKARLILNVLVTAAEVTENLPMQEMLFRSTFRWRLRPCSVTRDAALRHQGEHSGHREGRHPRLQRAGRPGKAHLPADHRGLPLRCTKGRLHLPERRSCALGAKTTGEDTQGRVREVRCELFSLQRVSSQKQVYE